jgi:hypothetical protein
MKNTGGWYRMVDGRWINAPIIRERGLRQGAEKATDMRLV